VSAHRAVLWDMDGTLIDSEELHWIAWQETMASVGHTITHEQFLSSFGQRNDSIISGWLGPTATPERVAKIGDAKEKRYRDLVRRNGISPLPGVADWIRRLHGGEWLQAIASSAPRLNVEVILQALTVADCFQAIVSAEDVSKGKPDPEVYLTAASKVVAPPARCVVVEDAPAGIEGARKAGMRSIGVNHGGKNLDADVVVASLDLLQPDVFETLLRK